MVSMMMVFVVMAEAVEIVEAFGTMEELRFVEFPCYRHKDDGRHPTGNHVDSVVGTNIHRG